MTISLVLLLLGAASAVADPPTDAATPAAPANEIERVITPRSQQFRLRSRGGREYLIQVAEPKDGPPKTGYPVIYALDGNAVFATFAEAVRVQRRGAPMLVVGIGYPSDDPFDSSRTYDFTPVQDPAEHRCRFPRKAGRAGRVPDIYRRRFEAAHREKIQGEPRSPDSLRTFLGWLFALHVLYTRPDAFQIYAAGAPSIWWNDQSILAEERAFFDKKGAKADVFLFVGERDGRHMVHDATRLADRLAPLSAHGLRLYFQVFEGEDHVSVLPAAISRAHRIAADGGNR